jgi:hypothetical protein
MNYLIVRLLFFLALISPLAAAEEWRTWTSTAGTSLEGRFVSATASEVTLERKSGTTFTVKLSQISDADRKFVADRRAASSPKGETELPALDAAAGRISGEIACAAESEWSYFIYLPQQFHTGRKWPVCFVMSPGGGSPGTLERYRAAADRYGIMLAVSKQSKNGFKESEKAMIAMNKDVYERLPILDDMSFSSGMSGGGRMAYRLAELDDRIAGVLACGTGGGVYLSDGSFRHSKLKKSVMICSLIGTNCFNRSEAAKSHTEFPKSAQLIWFEGNHDWAGSDLIEKGMAQIYGSALAASRDQSLYPMHEKFAATQLARAVEHKEDAPWETLRWARMLKDSPTALSAEAATLANEMERNSEAERGLKAEKEMHNFAEKHFKHGDNTPDSSREKDAEKLSLTYQDLPHAKIIERMGKPSLGP